jgi:hypothetical protein
MPVLGICNGFQILCEAHLLPGALVRNDVQTFVCRDQDLRVESVDTTWTSDFTTGQQITIVLKNGEGATSPTRTRWTGLEGEGRVVFRYLNGNPNGARRDIAGICNERGNVGRADAAPRAQRRPADRTDVDGRPVLHQRAELPLRAGCRRSGWCVSLRAGSRCCSCWPGSSPGCAGSPRCPSRPSIRRRSSPTRWWSSG